ncbi:MAG TPA: DMT family transporter [Acidimicrobiia bacterium]|nr:DMT family transporter [Acidimicrobiia bacterium]
MGSRRPLVASLALCFAAFLFGATFVVVKEAITVLPPMSFIAWRFLLGGVVLALFALPRTRAVWRDGSLLGVLLFAGFALQTEGLARTSASNSGLITGLYVVFTPLLAALASRIAGRPAVVRIPTLVGVLLAFVGLAMLTVGDGLSLAAGDLLTVGCAIAFACHIVALATMAPRHPVVPLTAVQLLVTSALAFVLAAATGRIQTPTDEVLVALLLTGLAVSAGAFLIQVWAQTVIGPSRTAVLLALEPAFAAATAVVVLGERLTPRGWAGAAIILVAIFMVLAQPEEPGVIEAEAVTPAH